MSLSREIFIIKQIMIKLNAKCENKEDTSIDVGQGQYKDAVDQTTAGMMGNINAR